jgi:K+-transporting ATPase ATPase C chain
MKGLLRPAIALTIWFVVLTGLAFPVLIYGIAQGAFPRQANGSLIKRADGGAIGSELIGQMFTRPEYFHPRPSAAGNGYDAANSGGTNLGPTSEKLLKGADGYDGVEKLAQQYRAENGLAANAIVPVDAVTRSASGLDPDISVENATLQVARVARARRVSETVVRDLVRKLTAGPTMGFIGEARVNVLQLNLALDRTERTQS